MNIIQLLRILHKNILLLLIGPIIMASIVFYLTRNEKQIFESQTSIYTGITSGYTIESTNNAKVDNFASSIAFDNLLNIIKARETQEKVAIGLLSQNLMLSKPDPNYLSKQAFKELQDIVPKDVMALVDKNSYDNTFDNLLNYKNKDQKNFIYNLLNYSHPFYSINAISGIKARRVQNSDLIELKYENSDPGICYQTLKLITRYFIKNYKSLNENQTNDVVKYFEDQVQLAIRRLGLSEDEMLDFNRTNDIINYYEQTRNISSRKEELDNDIQKVNILIAEAQSALNELNKRLTSQDKIYLKSEEIINKRNKLADLNSKISLTEIYTEDENKNIAKLSQLKKDADKLKKDLEFDINQLYLYGNSREGIPLEKLLAPWLEKTLQLQESKANLEVLTKRKLEFFNIYRKFAPLGATLKRIERKIGVNESEYLELLRSLTSAKLRQQNIQFTSNLKIIDNPYYPINPKPSKRKMLVFVAGFFAFLFILIIIIGLEYFDSTVKTAHRAQELTKLKLIGIFPKLVNIRNSVNLDYISNRAVEIIVLSVLQKISTLKESKIPKTIVIYSTRRADGKTTVGLKIADKLREYGNSVLYLNNSEFDQNTISNDKCNCSYSINSSFFNIKNLYDFKTISNCQSTTDFDYVFIEMPSINNSSYPAEFIKNVDLSIMLLRANRSWGKADKNSLELFCNASSDNLLILNGVELWEMENVIDEIPKRRSHIRRLFKKILLLRFHEKYNIKIKR